MANHYNLRSQHSTWLKRLNYRCQFSGQRAGGHGHRYNFHHTHGGAYGHEKPGWNLLLLTPWAHRLVHTLGGTPMLGMQKNAVTIQNRRAKRLFCSWLWSFPNPLQRLFHLVCRIGGVGSVFLLGAISLFIYAMSQL